MSLPVGRSVRWRTDAQCSIPNGRGGRCRSTLKAVAFVTRVRTNEEGSMHIALTVGPLVSLIAGILILVVPRLLKFIVAIYLIVIGLLGLFGSGNLHL
jgi:hypothetical protein